MKKVVGVLIGLAAAFGGEPHSGLPPDDRYDSCQTDYLFADGYTGALSCGIYLIAVDGSRGTFVGDGIEPAWSPDGSRIAFTTFEPAGGLSVANFGDWTLAKLTTGDSPGVTTYTVPLIVTDDGGAIGTQSRVVTLDGR